MKDLYMNISPIILKNLDYLVNHYYNSTKVDSWKFNQFYYVLKDQENNLTEEELIFKCLIYIYENFVMYAFKYDISECLKLLKSTLENNKRSRSKYRRIRILESFARGKIITDRNLINLILEQLEKLIEYIINRMLPDEQKKSVGRLLGTKGKQWTKLDRPIKLLNPLKIQLDKINNIKLSKVE